MSKAYPCLEVDLKKLAHNTREIIKLCDENGVDPVIVTKVFCANETIVKTIVNEGIKTVGDSRIKNLMKLKHINCKKLLVRIPMKSEADSVVQYSDISLNSELEVIKELSHCALDHNKIHEIILMVDLGDLREGVLPQDVLDTVKDIIELPNIKLIGLGTNLTCYGGVIPEENNLTELVGLKNKIEEKFNIKLPIVSGGNSSSFYMVVNHTIPKGVNQLRIGEALVLGRETAFEQELNNLYNDSIILKGEIIELKEKPSLPKGRIGVDAFGNKPSFQDKGLMQRAIIALGKQDILLEGLTPLDSKIEILGASSDHLLLDLTKCRKKYKVGDIVGFHMNYGCLLAAMTSNYVNLEFKI